MPAVGRHGIRERPMHMVAWDRLSPCPCATPHRVPNIEHWVSVLVDDYGLDDRALKKLRDLAAKQRQGYMHANSIIGKLIKKMNDYRVPFINTSAFVVASVKNALRIMEDKGS